MRGVLSGGRLQAVVQRGGKSGYAPFSKKQHPQVENLRVRLTFASTCLWYGRKEHIPCPSSHFGPSCVAHLCSIPELIAMFVSSLRFLVPQIN